MDMQDSTLAQAPESMGHALNEASATAADAGTETNAAATAEAEAAAEVLMTDGEEEAVAEEAAREVTLESLLADALALLGKDGAEIGTDEIRPC